MSKPRKFTYLWVIQQHFSPYGWEDVSASEAWKETREDLKAYRENQPEYPTRVIRRRELNASN
jgi:hypothetical protein